MISTVALFVVMAVTADYADFRLVAEFPTMEACETTLLKVEDKAIRDQAFCTHMEYNERKELPEARPTKQPAKAAEEVNERSITPLADI